MNSLLFSNIPDPEEKFVSSLQTKLFERKYGSFGWLKYALLCAVVVVTAVFIYQPEKVAHTPVFDKVKALEQINVTLKKYHNPTKLNYSKTRTTEYDSQGSIITWNVSEGWGIECGATGGVGMTTYPDHTEYSYDNKERLVLYDTKNKEVTNEYMWPSNEPDNKNPYCYEIQESIDWYTKNRYIVNNEEPEVALANKDGKEVIKLEITYRNGYENNHSDVKVSRYYLKDSYIPYLTEYYDIKEGSFVLYKTQRYEGLETLEPTNDNLNSHLTMDLYWPKTLPKDVKIYEVMNSLETGAVKTRVSSIRIAKPKFNYNFVPLSPAPTISDDTYNNR